MAKRTADGYYLHPLPRPHLKILPNADPLTTWFKEKLPLYIGTNYGLQILRSGQIADHFVFEPSLAGRFEILSVTQ